MITINESLTKKIARIIGLIALASVIVQVGDSTNNHLARGDGPFAGTWSNYGYYTIWVNTLMGILFLRFSRVKTDLSAERNQSLAAFIALQILMVGLVYNLLLRDFFHPTGISIYTDHFLHVINPLLCLVYWMVLSPIDRLNYKLPFFWLSFPLSFFIVALIRGLLTDWYPYPFLNLSKIGPVALTLNFFGLTFTFLILGFAQIYCSKKFLKS